MRQRHIALWVSAAIHLAVVVALVSIAADRSADARAIQLNGTRVERQMGRDLLFEVLNGAGMPLRLTSIGGDDAVGLAWWSPTIGVWLAVDRLPAARAGQSFDATLQVGDRRPERLGRIDLDETGSGRIVSAWPGVYPPAGTPVTLTVSERSHLPWSDAHPFLAATAPMRGLDASVTAHRTTHNP